MFQLLHPHNNFLLMDARPFDFNESFNGDDTNTRGVIAPYILYSRALTGYLFRGYLPSNCDF